MAAENEQEKSIVQNLRDAGCEPETILFFLQMHEDGKRKDQLCLLANHRKKLLHEIHREQAKLDCLDYLMYQIRNHDRN